MRILLILILGLSLCACKNDPKTVEETPVQGTFGIDKASTIENKDKPVYSTKDQRAIDSMELLQESNAKGYALTPEMINQKLNRRSEATIVDAKPKSTRKDILPSPCSLVTKEQVAKVLDLDVKNISSKSGSQGGNSKSASCFYTWGGEGILLQATQNPLPDELSDFASRSLNNKRVVGETDFQNENKKILYNKFDLGEGAVYSNETKRFYFRHNEEFVYCISFNGDFPDRKMMKAVKKLGTIILDKRS